MGKDLILTINFWCLWSALHSVLISTCFPFISFICYFQFMRFHFHAPADLMARTSGATPAVWNWFSPASPGVTANQTAACWMFEHQLFSCFYTFMLHLSLYMALRMERSLSSRLRNPNNHLTDHWWNHPFVLPWSNKPQQSVLLVPLW